jgi:alkylated DNA repair dioxygenase AlkB
MVRAPPPAARRRARVRHQKSMLIAISDSITSHVRVVLDEDVAFNELLSVLYREGQKMSWHDDGEEGECRHRPDLLLCILRDRD